jgi:hypothetical protein
MEDQDAGTQRFDEIHAVRAEEDHLAARAQRLQQGAQQDARVDVEAGKRLVEDEEVGIVEERRGNQHALPHPLREH